MERTVDSIAFAAGSPAASLEDGTVGRTRTEIVYRVLLTARYLQQSFGRCSSAVLRNVVPTEVPTAGKLSFHLLSKTLETKVLQTSITVLDKYSQDEIDCGYKPSPKFQQTKQLVSR